MPADASRALATSILISGRPGSAGSTRVAPRIATSDSGTFTYRHQRQFSSLVSTPPMTRPSAIPAVRVAVKMPITRARCFPSA